MWSLLYLVARALARLLVGGGQQGQDDALLTRNAALVTDWVAALADAPGVLLGTKQPSYPGLILASIALTRYVILGLFVSILVRRFARR
jgi:hypothetical protein